MVWAFTTCAAEAEPITIQLQGHVTLVDDLDNLLGGRVVTGSLISATYVYDSATTDSNSLPSVGDYGHYTAPFGITASAGGLAMWSDPSRTEFWVEICNDHLGSDNYLIRSYQNLHNLPVTLEMFIVDWQLDDPTQRAYSSDALPLVPPDLSAFQQVFGFEMFGQTPFDPPPLRFFLVRGVIESAWIVPEPSAFVLLGMGATGLLVFAWRRRAST